MGFVIHLNFQLISHPVAVSHLGVNFDYHFFVLQTLGYHVEVQRDQQYPKPLLKQKADIELKLLDGIGAFLLFLKTYYGLKWFKT